MISGASASAGGRDGDQRGGGAGGGGVDVNHALVVKMQAAHADRRQSPADPPARQFKGGEHSLIEQV